MTIINPFSQKGSPKRVKLSTYYQKKVYLFRQKGLPFLLKRSTFFEETVKSSAKRHYNVMIRSVKHVIDDSTLFYESSIISPYKLLSLQKIK